jgi:hypothetical protein
MRITRQRAHGRSLWALATTLVPALLATVLLAGTSLAAGSADVARSAAPGKPGGTAPNGSITQVKPTFTWSKAAGAAKYEVCVSRGGTLLVRKAGIGKLSWKCSKALPKNATLTWKVRGSNAHGAGAWSKSLRFKVVSGPKVGDVYQGGIVAYILRSGDPGYVAGQTHGLIAARADLSPSPYSNLITEEIGAAARGTAIGTGAANTAAIVAQPGCTGAAAYLCANLTEGGYGDWYLPSKDELNMLYANSLAVGGFGTYHYWSSTEYSFMFAWNEYFTTGYQDYNSKEYTYRVRPVRSF